MVRFENLTKIYPPRTKALDKVSFEIKPKEFVAIAGKSGAGKTTLLEILLGEERPTKGKVFFNNIAVHNLKRRDLFKIRQNIGVVFQDYKLISSKTAFENIGYALEAIGLSDQEIRRRVPQVLEIVDMEERINSYPAQLSEGERQRIAIGRALVTRPALVLADEPTGNLDPYHTQDIVQLLLKINELGTTVVLASHDKEVINALDKRVVSLKKGKVVSDQNPGKFIL